MIEKITILILSVTLMAVCFVKPVALNARIFTQQYIVDKNPENLEPETRLKYYKLRALAAERGIDFILTATKRTQEQQAMLYAQGRTTAGKQVTWTMKSKHLEGKAFDVAIKKNGLITWKSSDYDQFGALCQEVGLTWGKVKEPRDYEHCES